MWVSYVKDTGLHNGQKLPLWVCRRSEAEIENTIIKLCSSEGLVCSPVQMASFSSHYPHPRLSPLVQSFPGH